ncbi:uncharacterized protein METZ01_LOCUS460221, partial [marine metagenome]
GGDSGVWDGDRVERREEGVAGGLGGCPRAQYDL